MNGRRTAGLDLRLLTRLNIFHALEGVESVAQLLVLGALRAAEDDAAVLDEDRILLEVLALRLQPAAAHMGFWAKRQRLVAQP